MASEAMVWADRDGNVLAVQMPEAIDGEAIDGEANETAAG